MKLALTRRRHDDHYDQSQGIDEPTAHGAGDTDENTQILDSLNRSQAVIKFKPDGTIIHANQNFLATLGYGLDEIQGRHHRMFVDPIYAESVEYAEFWASLNRGEFKSAEFERFGKHGQSAWIQATYNPVFDEAGEVIMVIKFATDITRQKQSQFEIQNRSQAVIEFKPDGTIITANSLFLDTVGYSLDEIRGQHHSMFMPPGEADTTEYREFWPSLAAGTFKQGRFHRQTKAGELIWLQGAYNPVLDQNGDVIGVTKGVANITSQVQAQENSDRIGASIASGVAEMTSAISEIAQNINRTASLAQDAETDAADAGNMVAQLNHSGETIGRVVEVIQSLAEQTNMLALNATIEAARAGEAGRGFAVVANEVKDLATQTAQATANIDSSIQAIQTEVSNVVSTIEGIVGAVSEVSEHTTTVAAAVEEQSCLMSEINHSATELTEIHRSHA